MDTSELHALVEALGVEDVVMLLDIFLTDSLDQVRQVEANLGENDLESVRRGAHALKGSAMNMGATALATACSEVEHAESIGAAHASFQIMRALADEVREVFGKEMKALQERAA